MEPPEGWDPYGRPARRTQWLLSALAYNYGLERGTENEMVVLATGLEQSLQEIFQQLHRAGVGRIPDEALARCARGWGRRRRRSPRRARGCGTGSGPSSPSAASTGGPAATSAPAEAGPRLPLGRESEHIESQIGPRSPRRARAAAAGALLPRVLRGGGGAGAGRARIAELQEEKGSLRQLVEDMRAALQSSGAWRRR
ncbi:hypothetical protein Nmel_012488 [Mimus melanotis]